MIEKTDGSSPFFDAVQSGVIVIDTARRIITANRLASQILERQAGELSGSATCYQLLAGRQTRCVDCPVDDDSIPWPKQKAMVIKGSDGKDCFLKVRHARWGEYIVLTIQDVSREMTVLRDVDLSKKEQQAKNVLLERRRQEAVRESKSLENLLNHLPEAIVAADEDFAVRHKNVAVSEMLLNADTAAKCHELLGNAQPCPRCPAVSGFHGAIGSKKSHKLNNRYFTEVITESPEGGGGLLTFYDITRQVELIGEIRETQKSLAQKNDILSSLVNVGACMQKEFSPQAVVEFFLDVFMPIIAAQSCVIMVNDIRPGTLWFSEQRGIGGGELEELTKAYLASDFSGAAFTGLAAAQLPWAQNTQLVLVGGHGRKVGLFLLEGEFDQNGHELIQLFTEPLGAYIHNQILMRQLEDKANTDPLTGLFNRGYFETALEQEQRKFNRYKIPYALVVADVNRLKEVNDRYGHAMGDLLLKTVSQLLVGAIRETDIAARLGGDEFVVLLSNTDGAGAQSFVSRLNGMVFAAEAIEVTDEVFFPVTVSLGAAGADEFPQEEVVRMADERMYDNKKLYYQDRARYR